MAGWIVGWLGVGLVLAILRRLCRPELPGRKALGSFGFAEWIRLGAWREKIHEKHIFLRKFCHLRLLLV